MTGISPELPTRYLGPNTFIVPTVTRNRQPTDADYKQPETGKLYPVTTIWQVGKNPTTGSEGELWFLSKIVANLAYWVQLNDGGSTNIFIDVPDGVSPIERDVSDTIYFVSDSGAITITGSTLADPNTISFDLAGGLPALLKIEVDDFVPPGTDPVLASTTPPDEGLITISGDLVGPSLIPIQTISRAANAFNIEVQISTDTAISDADLNGLSHYSNAQFTVDANGFVELLGGPGPALTKFDVDANTAPGTDPVIPTAGGVVTVTGGQVAAGTVGANVIRTDSLAANTYTIEIQRSTTNATPDSTKNGVSHYNLANFNVDSNGFVTAKGGLQPGVSNLSISYNAGTGTFTILGADGSNLSATNPAYVTTQSNLTPGKLVTIAITANQSFIDDNGASQIIGNTFGTTAATAWAQDCPFFIYAVLKEDDTAIAFMISRQPNHYRSNGANIAKSGSAVALNQNDYFSLDSSITVTDYDISSALYCGFFRMRKSAADDWTVQTLNTGDGINRFPEDRFVFPTGQLGAVAGSYFSSSVGGNTIPTFGGTVNYLYSFTPQGYVNVYFQAGTCTASGVGAGNLRFHVPAVIADGNIGCAPAHFLYRLLAGTYIVNAVNNNGLALTYYTMPNINPAGGALLTPADIVNTSTAFCCQISYYGWSH